jgi:twinkle protein
MKNFRDFGIDLPDNFSGDRAASCPECSSSRKKQNAKCLSANGDLGIWVCHHCDWRGTLKTGAENKSQPYRKPKVYSKPAYSPPVIKEMVSGLPRKVVEWFANRGIAESILIRNKIGCGQVWMPQVEDQVIAIQFPYFRAGEVINIKYRDKDKNFRLASGAELILYGLDDIAEESLIIVEGEIDKLSLEVAGFQSVVSVPNGAAPIKTANYDRRLAYLESAADHLQTVKKFIIAVDADEPGQKLEAELIRRLGVEACYRVRWPEGCKDANEVLVRHGADTLRQSIHSAEPIPIEGWIELDKAEFLRLCEEGRPRGLDPGWGNLSAHYTVKPGDWTVITGIPQAGKSTFLDAMLVKMADKHDWEFGIFSPEMSPFEDHAIIWAEQYNESPTRALSEAKRENSYHWIKEHFHGIEPDDSPTLDKVLDIARLMVLRRGIRGLVIDPWNELEHNRGNLSETDHVSACLTKIRNFARQNNIHIWIIAHPTKLLATKSEGGREVYPVPNPYHISGSSNWRNKADCCLAVWRDYSKDDDLVQVHIQKIRRKEVGRLGMVEFFYDRNCNRFIETGETGKVIDSTPTNNNSQEEEFKF